MRFQLAVEIKSDSQPHVIFFVLVPQNVIVVHGELFVFVDSMLSGMRWVLCWDVVVRIDVPMV
jgi:hypothetical protein